MRDDVRVHEDTLDAITQLCDWMEERQFEQTNRWQDDGGHACLACGKQVVLQDSFGEKMTPEEERHHPGCELVAKIAVLRAFVRAESPHA